MPTSISMISGSTLRLTTLTLPIAWIAKLFDAFDALGRSPGMGHKRDDLTDYPILLWPVGKYLILYRARAGKAIEIVAETQGARDIPAFIRRRML